VEGNLIQKKDCKAKEMRKTILKVCKAEIFLIYKTKIQPVADKVMLITIDVKMKEYLIKVHQMIMKI
jgi:hypothetical protein